MPTKADPKDPKLQDFYSELEGLLRKQLEGNPQLDDVRLKLLELYFEQSRKQDFLNAAHMYYRRLDNPKKSRDWQRVASMGRMLMPAELLFSGERSDVIEFVGLPSATAPPEPKKVQRFGDEVGYRELFETLAARYEQVRHDARFLIDLERVLVSLPNWRPTPLVHAKRLSEHVRGGQIYFKREDLADEAPHMVAAITGQTMLALRLGCRSVVAGTSDGRRGVVTASVAARLGLRAVIYMDSAQAERSAANVMFMRLLGADVKLSKAQQYRNNDIRQAALEHWGRNKDESLLVMGLDAAPAPYPVMTQEFVTTIGRECRRQITGSGRALPSAMVARGSTSADALGVFPAFFSDKGTRLICVDGEREREPDKSKSDLFNQVGMVSSSERKLAERILDRLEYPSVAREHALLRASGRVEYVTTPRAAAREALTDLARLEGNIVPVATAHALAHACLEARQLKHHQSVVVLLSEKLDNTGWDIRRLVDDPG